MTVSYEAHLDESPSLRAAFRALRVLVAVGSGLVLAAPAGADFVINNGLAPPNPENVLNVNYGSATVYIRNVGCPPDWPGGGGGGGPCPSPGDPTEAALVNGGDVAHLIVQDSSKLTMSGGEANLVDALDSSRVTMSGGTAFWGVRIHHSAALAMSGGLVEGSLFGLGSASVTISGGVVDEELTAFHSSNMTLIGSDFEVDGVPVPDGELDAVTGVLTGTLESGDALDNVFHQGEPSGEVTGTIVLQRIPEPSQPLLGAGALATLALLPRRRQSSMRGLRTRITEA